MSNLTPPPQLAEKIIEEIHFQKNLSKVKRAIALWILAFSASWSSFIFFCRIFYHQASQTGFSDLSQLAISDFGVIKHHLAEYLFSLAESLPAVSVALLGLAVLLIILTALKLFATSVELRQIKHS